MKNELEGRLNQAVNKMNRFILEVLTSRNDVNKKLLNEFEKVITDYKKDNNIETLYRLIEIDNRPVQEGSDTDYTTGTSLPLDGEYTSLMKLMNKIQDLISEIRKA